MKVLIDEYDPDKTVIFDDWEPRKSFLYKSTYLKVLANLYEIACYVDEDEAVLLAEDMFKENIKLYFDISDTTDEDETVGKIHACNDFSNGSDVFGENYK